MHRYYTYWFVVFMMHVLFVTCLRVDLDTPDRVIQFQENESWWEEKVSCRLEVAGEENESRLEVAWEGNESWMEVAREKELEVAGEENVSRLEVARQENVSRLEVARQENVSRLEVARHENESRLEVARQENESRLGIAGQESESRLEVAGQENVSRLEVAGEEKEGIAITQPGGVSQGDSEEIYSLQQQLETQGQQLATQGQQLATQEQQLATQEEKWATQQQQLATQEEKWATQQQQLATQEEKWATQQQQLATQEEKWATQERQLGKQEHQLATQVRQLDTQELQLDIQGRQLTTQERQLATQERQLATQRLQLATQQQENRELASQVEQLTREQGSLQSQNQQLTSQGQQVTRQLSALTEQNRKQQQQLTDQLEEMQQQLQSLLQQVQSLQPSWSITQQDLQITTQVLGRGAWGEVRVGIYQGTRVAIKKMHDVIISNHNRELFEREMIIASKVRHPNLVLFIGAVTTGNLTIVGELMETSLRKLLEEEKLKVSDLRPISKDVACALAYLHSLPDPIVHRDVSSANVLLYAKREGWCAKLSDFGSANFLAKLGTVAPGAFIYSAPEALHPLQQGPKMDIYSFGILLFEMCVGKLIHQHNLQATKAAVAKWSDDEKKFLGEFALRCTETSPDKRPNMADFVNQT